MSNTSRKKSILNWLESEKTKDKREIEKSKEKYIQEYDIVFYYANYTKLNLYPKLG